MKKKIFIVASSAVVVMALAISGLYCLGSGCLERRIVSGEFQNFQIGDSMSEVYNALAENNEVEHVRPGMIESVSIYRDNLKELSRLRDFPRFRIRAEDMVVEISLEGGKVSDHWYIVDRQTLRGLEVGVPIESLFSQIESISHEKDFAVFPVIPGAKWVSVRNDQGEGLACLKKYDVWVYRQDRFRSVVKLIFEDGYLSAIRQTIYFFEFP